MLVFNEITLSKLQTSLSQDLLSNNSFDAPFTEHIALADQKRL